MEESSKESFSDKLISCYCWQCFVQAEFLQDFGIIQEYRCPKCLTQIRLGDADTFDPLRTVEDDADSVSVSPSTTSRRSTITNSESETGANDDVDYRVRTPDNFDLLLGHTPSVPTNTPADGDIPDASPNIAQAFADITNYLLNVPTPRRRIKRYSFGALSNMGRSDSVSPSKIITDVVNAYGRRLLEPEKKVDDFDQNIEIRITSSPDTTDVCPKVSCRQVGASEIRGGVKPEAGNNLCNNEDNV